MAHEKLIGLRKEKGLSQRQLAERISMEQTTYSRKERGLSPITLDEWQRIADSLQVSIEDIREDQGITMKNENCTFNDNSVGLQYINIPQDVLNMVIRYNSKLEQEISDLKSQLENFKQK